MGLFSDSRNGSVVDAPAFFDSAVPEQAGRLVAMGLLVAFGSTRDRGAISIQVTCDGEWDRQYFRRPDEAADWLAGIASTAAAQGIGSPPQDLPVVQKPTRRRSGLRGAP